MLKLSTPLSRTTLVVSAAAMALSACVSSTNLPPSAARHRIQVAESIERLELYPRADGFEMSSRDRAAMMGFLAAYARSGSGPLYLNAPSGGGHGVGIARSHISGALGSLGISQAALQSGSYRTAAGAPAPLVVSYRRLKTLVPDCRRSADLTATGQNAPSPDWGCAFHANIAAMVADPNQFIEPYPMTEPNATRRMVIYDKYIEGTPTAATKPPEQRVSSRDAGGTGG